MARWFASQCSVRQRGESFVRCSAFFTACVTKTERAPSRGPSDRWRCTLVIGASGGRASPHGSRGQRRRSRPGRCSNRSSAVAWVIVTATIVRARRAYADAHAARTGVKANLRHCGRGGEDGRCCKKAKCDLFHDGSPLGTWIGKRARRNVVPPPATCWSQVPCKDYRTNFAELWNKKFWNEFWRVRHACLI